MNQRRIKLFYERAVQDFRSFGRLSSIDLSDFNRKTVGNFLFGLSKGFIGKLFLPSAYLLNNYILHARYRKALRYQ